MNFPELIHRQFDVRPGEYIDIDFLGDWHGGHPLYLQDILESVIKEIEQRDDRYAILMGDPMEVGTKTSVADGVYEQTMDPDEQEDYTGDLLAPAGDEEKLLGGVGGNHGNRTRKSDGIRVDRTIAKYAGYPFNPMCLYYLIEINDIIHTIFTTHGQTSSSREAYQNLVIRRWQLSHGGADFYCMGHVHRMDEQLQTDKLYQVNVDKEHHEVVETFTQPVSFFFTGHYMGYRGGYAQGMGLQPKPAGHPRLRFHSDGRVTYIPVWAHQR